MQRLMMTAKPFATMTSVAGTNSIRLNVGVRLGEAGLADNVVALFCGVVVVLWQKPRDTRCIAVVAVVATSRVVDVVSRRSILVTLLTRPPHSARFWLRWERTVQVPAAHWSHGTRDV